MRITTKKHLIPWKIVLILFPLLSATACSSADATKAPFPSFHPFKSVEAQQRYIAFNETLSKKWPVPYDGKFVETSFGKTFVRICGPEGAAPLILLPGSSANSLSWRQNAGFLSGNFRIIAVDNINDFGRSVFTRAPKNADDFSKWLNELFDGLNLHGQINLMGTSYGGWIASKYAIANPGRLASLILAAPAATVLPIQSGFVFRTLMALIHPHFARSFMYWVFSDLAKQNESGHQRVEEIIEESALCAKCFKPFKLVLPTVLKDNELKNLGIPTLFIVGENEKLYSAEKAIRRLNEKAPNVKTVLIPDAGHDLMVSQVDRFNSVVVSFLK
jgi:pimeloyl-ACP methyl ester carboxylesterase